MFIDSSKVDATLTDFPVTIILSIASGIGDADVSAVFDELTSDANRFKIAVTDENNQQLYVEIESWDDATETAVLHVKVPSISSSANTILYLYYDSAQADNTSYVGDTTDAVTHNVWDANFAAVWHMAQSPNGDTAGAIKDSTVNANDGKPEANMTTADLVTAKVGKGIDFDGSNDRILFPNDGSLTCGSGDFTIEAVVFNDVVNDDWIWSNYGLNNYNASVLILDTSKFKAFFRDGSQNALNIHGSIVGQPSTWYHVAGVRNSTTGYLYVNGSQDGSDSNASIGNVDTSDGPGPRISSDPWDFDFFDGIQDEVSLSLSARSAAWIKATYNSLWDSLITFS